MATYTSYLNLKKPEGGERYALADFNANMQAIDDFAASIVPIKFGSSSKSIDQNLADYWTTYIPNDNVPHLVNITAQYGVCAGFLSRYSDYYGSGCLTRYDGTIYRVRMDNGSISNQPLALNSQKATIGKATFTPVIPRITYSGLVDNYAIRSGDIVYARARFKVDSVDTGNTYINGNSFPIFGGTLRYISGIWSDENNDTGGEIHGSSNGNAWFMKNGANYRINENAGHTIWISATYAIDNS